MCLRYSFISSQNWTSCYIYIGTYLLALSFQRLYSDRGAIREKNKHVKYLAWERSRLYAETHTKKNGCWNFHEIEVAVLYTRS